MLILASDIPFSQQEAPHSVLRESMIRTKVDAVPCNWIMGIWGSFHQGTLITVSMHSDTGDYAFTANYVTPAT